MSTSPTDPTLLAGLVAGTAGTLLLVQARVQSRLLRRRIASGAGTVAVDPATGLFSAAAAWQCIRAEANRSARLGRPLDVWVGTAADAAALDACGRELAFSMPPGATGMRVDRTRICVVSCAGDTGSPEAADLEGITWSSRRIAAGDDAATDAFAFMSEAIGA
ncbi:MAG: hypothetical protein JWM98_372 [Thermoleophilia bacterium]|nr:hypothetical protein [Thermoleophilia bacterium]